jgi:hypothetical protein
MIDKKYINDFRKGYIAGYIKSAGLKGEEITELKNSLKDDAKIIKLIKRKR